MEQIPTLSIELIEKLNEIYTPLDITPSTKLEEIYFDAGIQSVMKYLNYLLKRENGEIE